MQPVEIILIIFGVIVLLFIAGLFWLVRLLITIRRELKNVVFYIYKMWKGE